MAATARASRAARASSAIGAAAMAARARSVRSAMRSSTRARAPVSSRRRRTASNSAGTRVGSPRTSSQQPASGLVRLLLGERDQQGLLALAEVVVGGLPGHGRVAEHPEDVVAQLERLAERQPDGGVGLDDLGIGAGDRGAELEGTLHGVAGALVAGDRQRAVRAGQPARGAQQVEVLAGGDLGAHGVPDGAGPGQRRRGDARAAEELVGPHEGEVADQDRGAGAEHLAVAVERLVGVPVGEPDVRGGPAPSRVGAVHDVVVDERADVHELQCRDGLQHGGVVLGRLRGAGAGAAPAPVGEGRAQPLAPFGEATTSSTTGARLGSIAARVSRWRSRKSVSASVTAPRSRSRSATVNGDAGGRAAGPRSCVPAVTDPVSPTPAGRVRASRAATRAAAHRVSPCSRRSARRSSRRPSPPCSRTSDGGAAAGCGAVRKRSAPSTPAAVPRPYPRCP